MKEIILENAVENGLSVQDFGSEWFKTEGAHSQTVKGPGVLSRSGPKGCAEKPFSTAFSRIIRESCTQLDSEMIEMEVMPDHVHLLVEVDPQFGIHRLVKQIKGRSSRFLRSEFPHLCSRLPTLWTNSYFVSTVGGAPMEIVKQYVENQKHA